MASNFITCYCRLKALLAKKEKCISKHTSRRKMTHQRFSWCGEVLWRSSDVRSVLSKRNPNQLRWCHLLQPCQCGDLIVPSSGTASKQEPMRREKVSSICPACTEGTLWCPTRARRLLSNQVGAEGLPRPIWPPLALGTSGPLCEDNQGASLTLFLLDWF